MSTHSGLFVVIEGTDGSGKATQTKLLVERLRSEGYDVETFEFPQYESESSYFVRQYLNGIYGTAEGVGPYTGSLFYALDRYEAAPRIKKALDAGKIVIADRFTGSNMAHQGTKFINTAERKGYFLWLDAIEFQMLNIPRPTLSLVLRVPAETAQSLIDQKQARSYTDNKRDLHEADIEHLKKSVDVYDDLCDLFPKDFKRLDCVRKNSLLDIKTIQNMVWETILPLLPEKKHKVSSSESEIIQKSNPKKEITLITKHIIIDNVSALTANTITRDRAIVHIQAPLDTQHYYVPNNLDPQTKKQYIAIMDTIFKTNALLLPKLVEHTVNTTDIGKQAARQLSSQTLHSLLPAATQLSAAVSGLPSHLERLASNLTNTGLEEGQEVSKAIYAQLPGTKASSSNPKQLVGTFAAKELPDYFHGENKTVQLTAVNPRNELDCIASILYPHTSLPLSEIREAIETWSYNKKADVLESYFADHTTNDALNHITYDWEFTTDFLTYMEFRELTNSNTEHQTLTPRYGYAVPRLIQDANLSDQYESCFDQSLKLYSILQSAGYNDEAQYATLLGHRTRWRYSCTVTALSELLSQAKQITQSNSVTTLISQMTEQVSEVHPIIASHF